MAVRSDLNCATSLVCACRLLSVKRPAAQHPLSILALLTLLDSESECADQITSGTCELIVHGHRGSARAENGPLLGMPEANPKIRAAE